MHRRPSPRLFESEALHRKRPQQRRSEQTVDRIKQAMRDLIAEGGYAGASTNRVARRARVNIASLYQYFPNREAIALALHEDASAELARVTHDELLATMTLPLEQGIPHLVSRLVAFMDQEQAVLMRLIEDVPELRESAQAMSLENLASHTSRAYLGQHLRGLDRRAMACKLYFVQHFGMDLIRRYVRDRPVEIPKARFVAELSDLIVAYLRKPPVA